MSRRGDNIRKRKDGRWEARYPHKTGINNEKKYCSVYGRTYQEARRKRDRILIIGQQRQVVDETPTFQDILSAWQVENRIRLKQASISH